MLMPLSLPDQHALLIARYLSASVLVVSLWDHILNLDREIRWVWHGPWSSSQILLLFNRYGGDASMIFIAAAIARMGTSDMTNETCQALTVVTSVYCIINSASSQFALLLTLCELWSKRKSLKRALTIGFAVCFALSFAFAIVKDHQSFDALARTSSHSCFLFSSGKPGYALGMWGGLMLFDVYTIALMLFNALQTPRHNDAEILSSLIRDGAFYFLACSGLRLLQLISCVLSGNGVALVSVLAWAIDNALSFRFFLEVKAAKAAQACADSSDDVGQSSFIVYREVRMDLI